MSGYDTDILEWSERQSALLRRLAAGEAVNEPPDWDNIADEVASLGREQLHAVESFLVRALEHILKAAAWPDSPAVPGWRAEAIRFRQEAAMRFAPSMQQRIDLDRLYARALRIMPESIGGAPPLPVPTACPVTLEELLSEA